MKKILNTIKAIFVLFLIIAFSYAIYYVYNNYFLTKAPSYNAVKGDYNELINVKGTIDTINTAEVHSKSTNMISKILVSEGDIVKAGDILAYLNDDKTHEYEKAELNYSEAKRNYEMSSKLYYAGDISKDNYKKSENAMELAKVALESLDIEDDIVVKSPIDGVVTKIDAKVGNVAGGLMPTRLFKIDDISKLKIKVDVKEKDVSKVKIGQKAKITADAMGDRVFAGKVSYISPVGEASVNNNTKKVIETIIDIDENEKNITAGVSAKVDIIVNTYKDVLIMPIECLLEETDASYVYIEDGTKKGRKVKIVPLAVGENDFIIRDDGTISINDMIKEVA